MSEKSFAIATVVSATAWGLLFYPPGIPKDRTGQPPQPVLPQAADANYRHDSGPQPMPLSVPENSAAEAPAPIATAIMTRHGETAMLSPAP